MRGRVIGLARWRAVLPDSDVPPRSYPSRLLLLATGFAAICMTGLGSEAARELLPPTALQQHVIRFNAMEDEPIVNLISNADAAQWLEANIPRFTCPDAELQEIYFFRWWALRKHLRRPLGPDGRPAESGHVFTEFINRAQPVSSALGHHLMEGRWLRDETYHDDYVLWWLRGAQGKAQARLHAYSQWLADAIWQRSLATGNSRFAVNLLSDLVADYRVWEQERQREDGMRATIPATVVSAAEKIAKDPQVLELIKDQSTDAAAKARWNQFLELVRKIGRAHV